MGESAVDLRVSVYDADTVPFGLRFRRTLEPLTDSVVVATGYPTGSGAGVTVTTGGDSSTDGPDPDPGGDPPSGMI